LIMMMRTIEWRDGIVLTIDQAKLPLKEVYLEIRSAKEMARAVQQMKVRGAPLLGAAAAYGLALTAYHSKAKTKKELMEELEASAALIRSTRPTAANLFWAIERVLQKARQNGGSVKETIATAVEEASRIAEEDLEANHAIGRNGATLIHGDDTILTHCNAGALATVGYGTALGVVRAAVEAGRKIRVIATETRPNLQGSRLTAFELSRDQIPVTLVTDDMVGYVMGKGLVKEVIVGADRIVEDAVINKIGTQTIAIVAKHYEVPFYVAAPTSTFDLKHNSKQVIIEERGREEVTHFQKNRVAPQNVTVINPSFDTTPLDLVSAIITEKGILRTPYRRAFERI
jgi:methylthioribose-1-phosphate isomerase